MTTLAELALGNDSPKTHDAFIDQQRKAHGSIDRYALQAIYAEHSRHPVRKDRHIGWLVDRIVAPIFISMTTPNKPTHFWITSPVYKPIKSKQAYNTYHAYAMDRNGKRYIVKWEEDADITSPFIAKPDSGDFWDGYPQ